MANMAIVTNVAYQVISPPDAKPKSFDPCRPSETDRSIISSSTMPPLSASQTLFYCHIQFFIIGASNSMLDKDVLGPGRYAELLEELKDKAEIALKIDVKAKGVLFPKGPSSLGQQLNKVKTTLREIGITVEVDSDSKTKQTPDLLQSVRTQERTLRVLRFSAS
jgi:hypothetical protein